MSALATEAPASARPDRRRTRQPAQKLFEPSGSTLEDLILGAWEDLAAGGPADCPVCGGEMRSAAGCGGCGADLS